MRENPAYSYAEVDDFKLNRLAAESLSKEIGHEIGSELFCRRALANLEILNNETKLNSIRSLMCVLQGGSHISPNEETAPEEGKKRSKVGIHHETRKSRTKLAANY